MPKKATARPPGYVMSHEALVETINHHPEQLPHKGEHETAELRRAEAHTCAGCDTRARHAYVVTPRGRDLRWVDLCHQCNAAFRDHLAQVAAHVRVTSDNEV